MTIRLLFALAAMPACLASAALADQVWDACLTKGDPRACAVILDRGEDEPAERRVVAHVNRGVSLAARGALDDAIADFTLALHLNPSYGPAYLQRSLAFERKGEKAKAVADRSRALKLGVDLAAAQKPQTRTAQAPVEAEEQPSGLVGGLLGGVLKSGRRILGQQPQSQPQPTPVEPPEEDAAPLPEAPSVAAVPSAPQEPAIVSSPVLTSGEKRIALVIGNTAYQTTRMLPNPRRDADAVAAALSASGFIVTKAPDLSRAALLSALDSFAEQAEGSDWALVYFAGHGLQIDGTNYLVPVDAKLKSDRNVSDESIALDRVLSSIESARKLRMVILDACRDNPFLASMKMTNATRSVSRGLGRIEPSGGALVAFAAKDGQVAEDGSDGANSPFATALVKRLQTPGLEIGKLFRLVRDDVLAATGKRQEPFVYGSLPGEDFFFRSAGK